MAAIPGLKETYVQLKTRMEKAVEDFRKAMAATRTGRASVHMLDSVTAQPDRTGARTRAADDHRAAL
jgi:ribosome recycling factor